MRSLQQKFRNLSLKLKISFTIISTLVVCLSIISVFAIKQRASVQKKEAEERMNLELAYMSSLFELGNNKDTASIKEIIRSKTFYENGYVSLIRKNGFCTLGKEYEGLNVSGKMFFLEILKQKTGKSKYKFPNDDNGKWRWQYFTYIKKIDSYIVLTIFEEDFLDKPLMVTVKILFFALIFTVFVFFLVIYFSIKYTIEKPIFYIVKTIHKISLGNLNQNIEVRSNDEIGKISSSLNTLIDGLKGVASFANQIEKGNYESDFKPLSKDDIIGNALVDMRESLKKADEEENKRKREDEKRNWTTNGIAKFSEILRLNTENLKDLGDKIIFNMVRYTNANQGAVYILNNDNSNHVYLEMISCYAWNKKRHFVDKKIDLGEDLVGQCVLDKETILLTEIPSDYIFITSGLGGENPNSLVIVPLKLNEEIFGVIELASFYTFEKHVIEFLEKIGENIAATVSSVKISERTTLLLQQSQEQSEELKSQEEEMRQNMEELHATQEEMERKEAEMTSQLEAINKTNAIVELDLYGNVLKVNDVFCSLLGYDKENLLGKNRSFFMPKEVLESEEHIKNWDLIKNGKSILSETKFLAVNDHFISVQISFNPIFDSSKNVSKILVLAIDISERTKLIEETQFQAEQSRVQEQEMRLFIEELQTTQDDMAKKDVEINGIINAINNSTPLLELDLNGIIIKANDLFEKISASNADNLIGKSYLDFVINDEEKEVFQKSFTTLLKGETIAGEAQRKTPKGILWFMETFTPVMGAENAIEKIILFVRDITERKKAENVQNALFSILSTVNDITDLQDLYISIHKNISKIIDARNFYIALINEKANKVTFDYFVDEEDKTPDPRPMKRGLTEYVFRTEKPALVSASDWLKLTEEGEIQRVGTPSVQWMGVPLITKNKKFGVMAIQSYHEDILFTENDKNVFIFVANQIASVIEKHLSLGK